MRLRTLPLSLAGVIMGTFIALRDSEVNLWVVILLYLTTVCLQILSNLSNELGDTLHGTDNSDEREGMHYSLMDGELTIPQIKKLITGAAIASIVFGTAMVWTSFGTLLGLYPVLFLILGALAIWSAINYTLGAHPYGYHGLGDIAVFIFFGVATVFGGYLLCAHELTSWSILLPTAAVGLFSVGVLNVNNIRDARTDAATRTTVAIVLGGRGSRIYQSVLLAGGWICMIAYTLLTGGFWLYLITLPLFALHLRGVWKGRGRELDRMLPLLVMSTFLLVILTGIDLIK